MEQLIGEHQVHDALLVDGGSKVLVIAAREACTDAVMSIHHARDAVEAEAIKLVFVHPESEVGEQESKDLVTAIVEETAVPEFMTAFGALVEIAMIGTIKHVQSVEDVLAGMGMNDVEQDGNAHAVCGVDEFHELFGCPLEGLRAVG
jgi:hypothetical protein